MNELQRVPTPWDQLQWHSTTQLEQHHHRSTYHAPGASMHQHLILLLAICLLLQTPLVAARPRMSNKAIEDDRRQILKLHALKSDLDRGIAKSMMGFDNGAVYEIAKQNSPLRRQPTARFVDDSPILMQVSADVIETPPAPTIVSKTERRSTHHFDYDTKDYYQTEEHMRPACSPTEIACPSTRGSRFVRCISMRQLCDGIPQCPRGEDEREQQCMFYKATATFMAHKFEHILRSFHLYHDSLDALWQRQQETDRILHAEL